MNEIINLYKPVGLTPLEAIQSFKARFPEYSETAFTYAGRLDPVAEGVLLLLSGEAIKHKDDFLNLNKKYTAQILFGIKTDSFDILGFPTLGKSEIISEEKIQQKLRSYEGENIFTVPAYSSIPVNGKPLYYWAMQNKLSEIQIPTKVFKIFNINVLENSNINSKELFEQIKTKVSKVNGDFRQKLILEQWENLLNSANTFQTVTVKIECASGTYIRSIADQLGKDLGSLAILLNLVRDSVGPYSKEDSIKI